ncbi:MAG: amino acid adenylation protein, partial [Gemmatimonadetes bacterium]|nr:amino acid adenylation protein [Gemmatimonadota bacterium]
FQVKVQGHRIELGEIESVLEQHPAVRNAVAAAVGERNERRLVAYVTLAEGASGAAAAAPLCPEPAAQLAGTLECLRQARLAESPLPKYRYPSARTLYPVQAYVAVPSPVGRIGAGTYYYDPRAHRLVRVAPPFPGDLQPGLDEPAVFLVARLAAIAPIYRGLSPDFCLIEAGYMQALLTAAAAAQGLALTPAAIASPERVQRHLGLDEGHVPLQCLRLAPAGTEGPVETARRTAWASMSSLLAGHALSAAQPVLDDVERLELELSEPGLRSPRPDDTTVELDSASGPGGAAVDDLLYRSSDRDFLRDAIPLGDFRTLLDVLAMQLPASLADELAVGLYAAPGAIEGLTPGGYRYALRDRQLSLVAPMEGFPADVHAPHNREVFERSGFSLLLCSAPPSGGAGEGARERDGSLLLAGGVGQMLMTAGPAMGIGLCPIGSLEFDRVRHLFGLEGDAVFLHAFVGGRIPPRARPAPRAGARGAASVSADAAAGPDGTIESVRQFLAAKLPEYMVPRRIVALDAFPLSSNGKVDRKALPQIEDFDTPVWTAPRTPVEERFSEIWQELLGVARVGVEDSFFALGGDSVKAIQFLARAREAGHEIDVRHFFREPRIAPLARLVAPQGGDGHAGGTAGAAAGAALTPVVSDTELTQEELEQLIAEFGDTMDGDPSA